MVENIHRALGIEVHNQRLKKSGYEVEFYFDTRDVQRALVGFEDLVHYSSGELKLKHESFSNDVLVAFLLADGWLGDFHMLSPHQAELLRQMETSQLFQDGRGIDNIKRQDYFRELGLLSAPPGQPVPSGEEDIAHLVKKHADNASRLFIAVQSARFTWNQRLHQWRESGTFDLSEGPVNPHEIVKRSTFSKVVDEFSTLRDPNRTRKRRKFNDFADAVVLLSLVELTSLFNRKERVQYPRFFDSTGLFETVAKRTGLLDQLEIASSDGRTSSVLVDSEFFIYRASLMEHEDRYQASNKGNLKHLNPCISGDDLEEIYDQLSDIVGQREPARLDALRRVEIAGRSLQEILNDLQECTFLKNVWLPVSANGEVRQVLEDIEVLSAENSQLVSADVDRAVNQTRETLRRNASQYREISGLWVRVEEGVRQLRESYKGVDLHREADPIRDFRLTKFPLSKSSFSSISEILNSLLDLALPEDQIREHKHWQKLIDSYVRATSHASVLDDEHALDAEIVSSVLWCMKLYPSIISFLDPLLDESDSNHSLKVILVAAFFETNQQVSKGKRLLKILEKRQAAARKGLEMGWDVEEFQSFTGLTISVAYLYFHLWLIERDGWQWRRADRAMPSLTAGAREIVEKAISYAEEACLAFEEQRVRNEDSTRIESSSQLYIDNHFLRSMRYAQNQRLYYMLELGDPCYRDQIGKAAAPMSDATLQNSTQWMWTYDDTLARYYHFRAVWTNDFNVWESLMDAAIQHAQKTSSKGPADNVHQVFFNFLIEQCDDGYEARLNSRFCWHRLEPK